MTDIRTMNQITNPVNLDLLIYFSAKRETETMTT